MTARRADLDAYVDNFTRRIIQDSLNEATAEYWLRRADQYARVGNARCDEIALACQRHATICEFQNFDEIYNAVIADNEHREAA